MLAVSIPALVQTLGGNRGMGVFRKSLVKKGEKKKKERDGVMHTHGGACANLYSNQ